MGLEIEKTEQGWVIELGGTPEWAPGYLTLKLGEPAWSLDNALALRFAREADAVAYAKAHLPRVDVRVREHGWDTLARGQTGEVDEKPPR